MPGNQMRDRNANTTDFKGRLTSIISLETEYPMQAATHTNDKDALSAGHENERSNRQRRPRT